MLYNVTSLAEPLHASLAQLISALPTGAEIAVPDPDDNDGSLDVSRLDDGLFVKRGRHGAHGTWRPEGLDGAVAWLYHGASRSEGARSGLWVWVPHQNR